MTYDERAASAVVCGLALGMLILVLGGPVLAPVLLALLFGVLVPR